LSLGKEATEPAALRLLKKEVIVQEAVSPKHLEGRWYVEVQFIEHETEEGYEIGSYGLFAKTKKAALGAARIIDHTSPYRIIIQDMEPKTYRMLNGEDGCSTEDEDEFQTSLEEFYSHQVVDPQNSTT